MKRVSETYGYKPIKNMQVDSMDPDLRTGLWNGLFIHYFAQLGNRSSFRSVIRWVVDLTFSLWVDFFKAPVDDIPKYPGVALAEIKTRFFALEWYAVYDLVQFVVDGSTEKTVNKHFIKYCNQVLEREVSGWRFVGKKMAPITSKEGIAAIEEALEAPASLRPVVIHLNSALNLISDKKSPDYRNSIKESISAVESMCTLVAGTKKGGLAQAIKVMRKKGMDLHPALEQAFTKLYGYTSNEGGIRHALLEEPNLHFEDAEFMLVACSAFVSYLRLKSSKAGIES